MGAPGGQHVLAPLPLAPLPPYMPRAHPVPPVVHDGQHDLHSSHVCSTQRSAFDKWSSRRVGLDVSALVDLYGTCSPPEIRIEPNPV